MYWWIETRCTHSDSWNTEIPAVDWTLYDPLTGLVWQHEKRRRRSPINEAGWEMVWGRKTASVEGKCQWAGWREQMHVGVRAVDRHLDKQLSSLCAAITSCGASPLPPPSSSPLASAGPAVWGLGAWNPGNNGGIDLCAWDGQLQLP